MIEQLQIGLTSGSSINILLSLSLIFLGGVVTSFTPCIFPMIPVVFSIISTTGGKSQTQKEVMTKVLLYGLGLSFSYVLLGMIAVLTKGIFGSFLHNIWIKIAIANLFFVIAFNTMGWIRIPQVYLNNMKLQSKSSLVLFGFLTGFTLSPCTMPVLAIVLAFSSQSSLLIGSLMLWVYSWGFFSILLLVALFGAEFKKKIPKSGPWLRKIEWALFILCLGIGEWFLLTSGGF